VVDIERERRDEENEARRPGIFKAFRTIVETDLNAASRWELNQLLSGAAKPLRLSISARKNSSARLKWRPLCISVNVDLRRTAQRSQKTSHGVQSHTTVFKEENHTGHVIALRST